MLSSFQASGKVTFAISSTSVSMSLSFQPYVATSELYRAQAQNDKQMALAHFTYSLATDIMSFFFLFFSTTQRIILIKVSHL